MKRPTHGDTCAVNISHPCDCSEGGAGFSNAHYYGYLKGLKEAAQVAEAYEPPDLDSDIAAGIAAAIRSLSETPSATLPPKKTQKVNKVVDSLLACRPEAIERVLQTHPELRRALSRALAEGGET